jgi:hypothetical protein
MATQDTGSADRLAEAARYALLRRLAPVIRHNMAGSMQPIAMVAGMLERRLQKPDADSDALLKNARDIVALSKEAAASCADLMSWFAPKEDPLVAIGTGIADCLGMLATELSFKGFSVVNKTAELDGELPLSAFRNPFTAAVIALTDAAGGPRTLVVEAEPSDGGVSIRISSKNALAPASTPAGKPYRRIEWRDVEALTGEFARLSHTEEQVVLYFQSAAGVAEKSRPDLTAAGLV